MALSKSKNILFLSQFSLAIFSIAVVLLCAALFAGAIYIAVFDMGQKQIGLLSPGETSSEPGFSRSLDLRVAAKNDYPSGPITITQELGVADGVSRMVFHFKVTADGLDEYGLMMLPSQKPSSGKYPTIILCHGYESPSQYSTTRDTLTDMSFYAQRGFAVLKPDFRGQGLSLNAGEADSAYYSMSYNTDLMSLLSAVKKTNNLDKTDISLWGFSMGAYIALRATVLSPDVKNLILLSGPVDSMKQMYLTYIPPSDVNNLRALKTRNDVFAKYGTPVENSSFWSAASPINFANRIKAHVQLHAGQLDQIVPPEFSADLDKALSQARVMHDYYTYPEGVHSLAAQRGLIWPRTLQILQTPAITPAA
ncbi:alpha/beta fold hydrolase [Candidatus Saccharibacteria bacterium]|nr:alpha/beta fold hydrolase [Candidatus Saccharibacteria bacterium]